MSKRIFVVEDREDNRRIMRDLLTDAGFEVIEAVNGNEALSVRERRSISDPLKEGILSNCHAKIYTARECLNDRC